MDENLQITFWDHSIVHLQCFANCRIFVTYSFIQCFIKIAKNKIPYFVCPIVNSVIALDSKAMTEFTIGQNRLNITNCY